MRIINAIFSTIRVILVKKWLEIEPHRVSEAVPFMRERSQLFFGLDRYSLCVALPVLRSCYFS
jgi:hypothetical protein